MQLKGRKAIVTGANRSIGAGIAKELASEGADVCISYRSDEKGAMKLIEELAVYHVKAYAIYADFEEPNGVELFFQKAIELLGGVDILVNNAGKYNTESFFDLQMNDFEAILKVGIIASARLSQLAAKSMINKQVKGCIINVSSVSGLKPFPNRVAHSSSKACLNMMTKNMALELGPYGIRVNAICPGGTPYEDGSGVPINAEEVPLKRHGIPSDQGRAVVYLASDDASWLTGQCIAIDGGESIAL